MSTPRFIALVTLSLSFVAFGLYLGSQNSDRLSVRDSIDEAQIYAAVLDTVAPRGQTIILLAVTDSNSFGERRAVTHIIPSRNPLRFVSETDLTVPDADIERYWRNFYARFPGSSGWYTMSDIEYNAAHREAMVWVRHRCGGLCGSWDLVRLSKTNGSWHITRFDVIMVS